MSYKSILSQKAPKKEALDKYFKGKCYDIEVQVNAFYDNAKRKAIDKEKTRLEKSKQRKLTSRIKSETIKYKSAIKSLKTGDIQIKTKPLSIAKLRNKAYTVFQKRRRLSLADKNGMVRAMDTTKLVKRNQKGIVSGHYYSKHNHPNLGFNPFNVRPIGTQTNRMQGDQPGHYRKDNLIAHIGQTMFDHLEEQSKETDNTIRDRTHRETAYDSWSKELQNEIETREKKGWII